jgi:hypothetical protein
MKYKLSDNASINKIGSEYYLVDISKSNSRYIINYSLFSILSEIETRFLDIDEIFEILEKKFPGISKDNFVEKTVPILNELLVKRLIVVEE